MKEGTICDTRDSTLAFNILLPIDLPLFVPTFAPKCVSCQRLRFTLSLGQLYYTNLLAGNEVRDQKGPNVNTLYWAHLFKARLCACTMDENKDVAKEAAKKRSNYLQWDEYFMALAFLSAQRSKDPSSQVGM